MRRRPIELLSHDLSCAPRPATIRTTIAATIIAPARNMRTPALTPKVLISTVRSRTKNNAAPQSTTTDIRCRYKTTASRGVYRGDDYTGRPRKRRDKDGPAWPRHGTDPPARGSDERDPTLDHGACCAAGPVARTLRRSALGAGSARPRRRHVSRPFQAALPQGLARGFPLSRVKLYTVSDRKRAQNCRRSLKLISKIR